MINEKLQEAFNDQINKELYSEYLYHAMKIYFQELNLQGFVNWFDVQVQEERAHAVGMINYLNDRGGKVELRGFSSGQTVDVYDTSGKCINHYSTSSDGALSIDVSSYSHGMNHRDRFIDPKE